MAKSNDSRTENIIDTVVERSGLSRDVVESVIQHIRNAVPMRSSATKELPQEARILPEIRFELSSKDTRSPNIDRHLFASNRSKLGGIADWMHDSEIPVCCGRLATFYAQIDTNLGPAINIVDAGVLYVFICDQCLATFTELQYH